MPHSRLPSAWFATSLVIASIDAIAGEVGSAGVKADDHTLLAGRGVLEVREVYCSIRTISKAR